MVRQAERVQQALAEVGENLAGQAQRVANRLATFLPRLRQVLDQAERRVRKGEQLPAQEKLVSLFEPHSAISPRHKPGQPVGFGRKRWLAAADGGLIPE